MTDTPEAVRLAALCDSGEILGDEYDAIASIMRRFPELEAEVQEQARLNGMGAERELALRAQVSRLEAEKAAWKEHAETLTHQVICCGVAASHPDPALTTRGAYAGKWNSAQAEKVRKLREERDQLRAELEKVRVPEGWVLAPVEMTDDMRDAGNEFICNRYLLKSAYAAMLAATPTPPAQQEEAQPIGHVVSYQPLEHTAVIEWYPAQNGVPPAGFNVGSKLYLISAQQPAGNVVMDAERLDWLLSQHWVEPEAKFRLNLEDSDDSAKYKRDAIAAIDAAIATHQQGGSNV